MKLWIDDIRDAPDDSWQVARKVQEAIHFIAMFGAQITEISLDHDIENRPSDETFNPVAHYFGLKYKYDASMSLYEGKTSMVAKATIHSVNPAGAKEMIDILEDYGVHAEWKPYLK